jgi:DNA-binding NtrC family response regulator
VRKIWDELSKYTGINKVIEDLNFKKKVFKMSKSKLAQLLVVDDETETLTPLCDLLSEWGYEVAGYTSCKEALEALKKQDFDLLLTDLVMPEMDGIELMKAAMEMDPLIVCIIITGKGTIQTAVEAMKVGAFDYVETNRVENF